MYNIILIGLSGAIGAVSRYGVNQYVSFYFGSNIIGTFIANTSGSFLLGLFIGIIATHTNWSNEVRLVVAVGFLGSYTTFSTLTVETIQLLQMGEPYAAGLNLVASIIVGLFAAILGLLIGKSI